MKLAFIIAKTPHHLTLSRDPRHCHLFIIFKSGAVKTTLLDIIDRGRIHIFLGLNRQSLPRNDELLLALFTYNKFSVAHMVSFSGRRPNFVIERAFLLSLVMFVDASRVETWREFALHLGMREMATRASATSPVSTERHRNRGAVRFLQGQRR